MIILKSGKRKGAPPRAVIGTSLATGDRIRLVGSTAIADAGFVQSSVWRCIKGERHQHGGFTWAYEDGEGVISREKRKQARDSCWMIGVNIETGESIRLMGEEMFTRMGFNFRNARRCAGGELMQTGGYIWRYESETTKSG